MNLGNTSDSVLGNFLGRPFRYASTTWPVGAPFFLEFNPWEEFVTNPRIAEKLANYELLRMNLKVKVVINGTPFHYGRLMMSYNPLSGYDQVTVQRTFFDVDLIGASQRPHVFCNPSTGEGGEIKCPYFFRENYMSLSKGDALDMGNITINSFDILRHANGGVNPVTVTTYIWAEDVVLTMPTSLTTALTLQSQSGKQGKSKAINSGDEYGMGIISKPASAIAKAAGALEQIPLIAPYMRATQMIASGVGDVAKLFGFSRPPVVTDIQLFKPSPTGNLTNVDAADAVQKLSLDSKAEVTIDPRVTGLGPADEMNINNILCKESYLTTFRWGTDDSPEGLLWQSYVNPSLHGIRGSEIHPTAMAFMANYFSKWQGSIKFRFQIMKSHYHKGRLLVRYDPRSFGSSIEYNTNYSRVVDIAEEEDFEITVGWGQNVPFLNVPSMDVRNNWYNTGPTRLSTNSTNHSNGVLEIDVMNELVTPLAAGEIYINVYVSMCDDVKVADPCQSRLSAYKLFTNVVEQSGVEDEPLLLESQSGEVDMPMAINHPTGTKSLQDIGSRGVASDETLNVFYGESPTTLREILKRYTFNRGWCPPDIGGDDTAIITLLNKDFPFHTGLDPGGIDLAADGITPLTVGGTTPISYFSVAFAGYRGALRKKYMFNARGFSDNPTVTRRHYASGGNGFMSAAVCADTQTTQYHTKFLTARMNTASNAGAAITNRRINNTLEVELPFYSDGRIGYTRLITAQDLNCNSHAVEMIKLGGTATPGNLMATMFQEWSAVGDDFSLYFFTGAPILYRYSTTEST